MKPRGKRRKVAKQKKHPNLGRGNPQPAKRNQNLSAKLSIKKLYEDVVREDPGMIKTQIKKGIKKGGFVALHHIQTAGNYIDGRPVSKADIGERQPIHFHFHLSEEEAKQ